MFEQTFKNIDDILHKVAAALADYGYNSMRLNDDWQGADFIAIKCEEMIKV